MMACDCISYNRPDWGGSIDEVVVTVPVHLRIGARDTVCLDLCIAPAVFALWAAGVKTYGSCCGHNGHAPRSIVIDGENVAAATAALDPRETAALAYWADNVLQVVERG